MYIHIYPCSIYLDRDRYINRYITHTRTHSLVLFLAFSLTQQQIHKYVYWYDTQVLVGSAMISRCHTSRTLERWYNQTKYLRELCRGLHVSRTILSQGICVCVFSLVFLCLCIFVPQSYSLYLARVRARDLSSNFLVFVSWCSVRWLRADNTKELHEEQTTDVCV